MSVVALVVAALFAFAPAQGAWAAEEFRVRLPNHENYSLRSTNDLARLASALDDLIRSEEQFLAQRKAERKKLRAETPLAEMSHVELKRYFAEPLDSPTGNELRALRQLQALCLQLSTNTAPDLDAEAIHLMAETARSIENLRRSPIPARMEVLFMPVIFLEYLHHPVGRGATRAANIHVATNDTDPSRIDPPDSTFWKKPATIGAADLFTGPGGAGWRDVSHALWEYSEPKTSFGTNPGFEVKRGDVRMKVKFGELHSEPFTARIFSALGYNAEPADFAPSLQIKYDRRLFREFNLRKEMDMQIHLLGVIPGGRVHVQRYRDPFQFIAAAVLKDGQRLTSAELKQRLLRNPNRERPEEDPANFDSAFEATIDHLVTSAANIQIRQAGVQNLGPWEFGGLGHEHLRELRGMGLLAAWLGWVDVRFDNTRLKVVTAGDATELKHYVSDLGGGLSKGVGFFSWQPDEANLFAWTFTTPQRRQGKGRMTIPFRIVNYRPVDRAAAFKEMTFDDARWMARMIGQFTEQQIIQALIASGYDSAEVRLLAEKLISRRDRMIVDLELADEIPLLRPRGSNRDFSYDPAQEGLVTVTLVSGEKVSARASDRKVANGRIERSARTH